MTIQRPIPSIARSSGWMRSVPAGLAAAAAVLLAAWWAPVHGQEQTEEQADAEQEETYEVDRGDTLWDLADEFLSDPFDWERIYELNEDRIDDPHWIYPGQRFLIPGRDGAVEAVAVREKDPEADEREEAEEEPEAGRGEGDPFDAPSIFDHNPEQEVTVADVQLDRGEAPPVVSESDFFRSSFVADWETVRPRGVTARVIRENPLGLEIPASVRLRNQIVLRLNGLQVEPGDTLQAVRPGRKLDDVRIVESMGLVEVRSVDGDSARAVVTAVYDDYQEGDPVISAEAYTWGDRRSLDEADRRLQGRVIGLAVDQALVSTGDHLYLDVGDGDGVAVGDEFAVFSSTVRNPREVPLQDRLGVVRVVRVRDGTSTARVVETRDVGMEAGLAVLRVREPVTDGG